MSVTITQVDVKQILTRSSGYLTEVSSHSLQPYRGCTFGNSLCGVGCYVQHNRFVTRGRPWGHFLEVRRNAPEIYEQTYVREQNWGRRQTGRFSIFCSSSTDPFLPQEQKYHITARLLQSMLLLPPDLLILQTHSPQVLRELSLLEQVADRTELRIHMSIETDREQIPGLPPPAASVAARMEACRQLTAAGLNCVVTVAPLLPIENPHQFFEQIAQVASAVVIDHFIEGDGSRYGSRTLRTRLPLAMEEILPESLSLEYREEMIALGQQHLPGRVGISQAGFAGKYV